MYASTQSLQHSFLWDFQEISSGIYIVRFQDTFHELSCEFSLELKESFVPSEDETKENFIQPVLVGNFPSIDIQRLQQKMLWDEYLYGTLLIQFQLKILEQLILLCEDKNATQLFLTFNETNQDYLEIYRRFLISEEEIISNHAEQTEIAIPTDVSVYDELIDFMEEIDHKFRQILWREQRENPLYRRFLKSEALV
jgi:hypothetical protein